MLKKKRPDTTNVSLYHMVACITNYLTKVTNVFVTNNSKYNILYDMIIWVTALLECNVKCIYFYLTTSKKTTIISYSLIVYNNLSVHLCM